MRGEGSGTAGALVISARRRARLLLILTAVLLVPVIVCAAAVWPRLPDPFPVRREASGWGFSWSSSRPVHNADKTVGTVFGPLLAAYLWLAAVWLATQVWPIGRLWFRAERWLFGDRAQDETFWIVFADEMVGWLSLGVILSFAFDTVGLWLMAIGRRAGVWQVAADIVVCLALAGLGVSGLHDWRQWRRLREMQQG